MENRHEINEYARLKDLRSYSILDTPPELSFDQIARLAAINCETPVALISFFDENRQWFKASYGLDVKEVPRHLSTCRYTFEESGINIIPNMLKNEVHKNDLIVRELGFHFYAGVPLISPRGCHLGTLCVMGPRPRTLTQQQQQVLKILSEQIIKQIEMRRIYQENLKSLWQVSSDKHQLEHDQKNLIQEIKFQDLEFISQGIILQVSDPLQMISAITQERLNGLELENQEQEVLKEEFSLIQSNCDRILKVLDSLRYFLTANSEKGLRPLDLGEMVQELVSLSLPNLTREGVVILDLEKDVIVLGNEAILAQALLALLLNAGDAVENLIEKEIKISVRKEGLFALISVEDSGLGVSDEVKNFIFQPFFTTKDKEKHHGLGLSMASELLTRFGGNVELERTHRPTVFILKYPLPIPPIRH